MTKHLKQIILVLIMICMSATVMAADFYENGIYYNIISVDPPEVEVWKEELLDGGSYYGNLVIPETVEHERIIYSVTKIKSYAFAGCYSLTSVVIPNTVTDIGDNAFAGDMGLTSVSFSNSNSLTSIGKYAFVLCNALTTIDIPNSVTYIGEEAFLQCEALSSVNIPNSLTTIEAGSFQECAALTSITIPESVKTIKRGAFWQSGLTSIEIPNSVNFIGEHAFGLTNITTATIGNSYTGDFINDEIFSCPITSLDFADDNPRYKSIDGVVFSHNIDTIIFYPTARESDYAIPNSVTTIGDRAFYGCSKLSSIVIPTSVTKIGPMAFYGCISLTSVVLPNSVTDIGGFVFSVCNSITEPIYNSRLFAFYPYNNVSSYNIPEGVEIIAEGAFANSLYANYGRILDSITVPNSVKIIRQRAFESCDSLTYVSLPESLETIGDHAFRWCSKLATINLPNSLTNIGVDVFKDCQNLQEPLFNNRYFAHFPKNYATTYSIPDGIEEVLEYAFIDCDSLKSITFPNSTTKIRNQIISDCHYLHEINILAETPPAIDTINAFPFYSSWPFNANIYVPTGTLETYLSSQWAYYYRYLEEKGKELSGREMYYEIMNDDGSITYQHLEFAADTVIGDERPMIIVRSNTQYDRDEIITEVTHEYVFERNGKMFWWNKGTEEFTLLYDFRAQVGDEWKIKVGTETITVHVDAIDYSTSYIYVSDTNNIFSGTIIPGVGHTSSFFPEKLMTSNKNYRVDGLRCYWKYGYLVINYSEMDCDEIYEQWHEGINETMGKDLVVYPNPATGILIVETQDFASLQGKSEYRIKNLIGQTIASGLINAENQQINIEKLPAGMYFITIGKETVKFVKR